MKTLSKVLCRQLLWIGMIGLIVLGFYSCTSDSDSVDASGKGNVPVPPALWTVPVSEQWVNVLWSESQRIPVNGFILYRRTGVNSHFSIIANLGPTVRVFVDSGLVPGQYSYYIHAYNDAGNSRSSDTVVINTLSVVYPPSRLLAKSIALGSVSLTWQNNSPSATGIRIERRSSNDPTGIIIDSVDGASTSYIDNLAPCGTALAYRLQAYNAARNSNFTSSAKIQTPFSGQTKVLTGSRASLYAVGILDEQNILAVGYSGAILRSANGGYNWVKIRAAIRTNLTGISTVNSDVAYASGDRGKVIKTTDGGMTWVSLVSGVTASLPAIYFLDELTGFLGGANGIILKTTDGGKTWKQLATSTTANLFNITFLNNSIGFAVGTSGTILKTTDGGARWLTRRSGAAATIRSIAFHNDTLGFAVGTGGLILKTKNGGDTWVQQTSNLLTMFNGISITDENKAFAVGSLAGMVYTVNGGSTWVRIPLTSQTNFYGIVQNPSTGEGFICGSGGVIYQTQTCR